jgi:glycosyltransferase involved in cell wall biosynthesis
MDGGSRDGSLAVIQKYAPHLAHWDSRPDRGQGHAINKGWRLSTGQILCWLNSDDFYLPDTLQVVAEALAGGTGVFAVAGHSMMVHADGSPPRKSVGRFEGLERLLQFWKGYQMHQPSIFWRREVFERVGYLDESHYYIMDFDYWVRIAGHFEFRNIDRVLSGATRHAGAKTADDYRGYFRDLRGFAPEYWGPRTRTRYWRLRMSLLKHDLAAHARRPYRAAGRMFKSLTQRSKPYSEFH